MKTIQQCMEAAQYRLEAARYLYDGGYNNDAIARAYFAAFAAVKGLLLTKEIESKTHAGVQSMLGLHFVKRQQMPAAMAASLSRLRQRREAYDYDGRVFPAEKSQQALSDTAHIIRHVATLL